MKVPVIVVVAMVLASCEPLTDAGPSIEGPIEPLLETGVITQVHDGDSVTLILDGVEEKARLAGINAPEFDECWGEEARAALAGLEGEEVRVERTAEGRDQYGRLLVHLWQDESLVNADLVANGAALGIRVDDHGSHDDLIDHAEAAARTAGMGMWAPDACGGPPPPRLRISTIAADPPGPDQDNLEEEWISIVNDDGGRIELVGYVLRDASTVHRYRFPDGSVLDPGAELRVVTGCGTDTPLILYWCSDGPVWDNGGDDALLLTDRGTVVDHHQYGG